MAPIIGSGRLPDFFSGSGCSSLHGGRDVNEHKWRIGAIWMLLDRSVKESSFIKTFEPAEKAEQAGYFEISPLSNGQILWQDTQRGITLKAIHPNFRENIRALISGQPNRASGLIVLESGDDILCCWPGDLEIRTVHKKLRGFSPFLMAGPHHGGPTDFPSCSVRKKAGKNAPQLRRDVLNAISGLSPERTFISVGTKNSHSHPRPGYIRLLAKEGAHVVCSQLTTCCDRLRIRNKSHVFQGEAALGLRAPRSGISCRGAIRFYLRNGALVPDEFDDEHRKRIEKLLRPQCLKWS